MCCTHLRLTQATGTRHHASKPTLSCKRNRRSNSNSLLKSGVVLLSTVLQYMPVAGTCRKADRSAHTQPTSHFACVLLSDTLLV